MVPPTGCVVVICTVENISVFPLGCTLERCVPERYLPKISAIVDGHWDV